ncbi:hypothetical protein HPB47_020724 [Ixodes persulcatus]|uniref:Uncharacterized protein n=1 Tax=Ixodes persulcatus TaxID=34615 RepID=A0AC60QEI4_IXOPE|nr:hypothetical protein HPB47_020724 [Ixodes persulcatus]
MLQMIMPSAHTIVQRARSGGERQAIDWSGEISFYCPVSSAVLQVGKRRGGKVLKTGVVHKPKVDDEEASHFGFQEELPKDAWSRYLAEVRKYRERSCDDEEKTRPLVK